MEQKKLRLFRFEAEDFIRESKKIKEDNTTKEIFYLDKQPSIRLINEYSVREAYERMAHRETVMRYECRYKYNPVVTPERLQKNLKEGNIYYCQRKIKEYSRYKIEIDGFVCAYTIPKAQRMVENFMIFYEGIQNASLEEARKKTMLLVF